MEKCAQCASQSSLRRCTGCFDVWYCSRDCQTKHWNQHRTTCSINTHRTMEKEAMVSEGRDRCSHCGSSCPRLRMCTGCLAAWYCSTECQGQHWPQHRSQCSTSKGRESSGKRTVETCVGGKRTVETCVQCASQSNLRRCTGCLKVWYCSKECQKQHWGLHKDDCKKKAKNEEETSESSEACQDDSRKPCQEVARYGEYSRFPQWVTFWCQSCGHRGKNEEKCDRCHQNIVKEFPATDTEETFWQALTLCDLAEGPIHQPVHVNSRQAEAARRTTEAKRLADLRNENCRLSKQHDDDDVIVTPILTWEEARFRASLLFPGKRIVDMFRELDNDLLALPDCQNIVSISKIKGPYDHWFRVARYVQDFEGKSVYMICYNEEEPEPYFLYDQLVEGNFFCIDHAHLHIFADKSVGFRVDYPWDVHIMEP